MPIPNTSAGHVDSFFYNQWIIPYRPPAFVEATNGILFVIKRFERFWTLLVLKQLTETA